MLKRLFAQEWVRSGLLFLVLVPLGSLGPAVSADDATRPDAAATPAVAEPKPAPAGTNGEPQLRKQEPFVRVEDITTDDSSTPTPYSFLPRKGRFELRVKKGWSGSIPINSHDQGWSHLSCQRIGNLPNQRFETAFASHDPVLEAGEFNGILVLNSVRKGTAAIQFIGGKKNAPAAARCELRIVVEGDTDELKQAIQEASPAASIRIVEIRDSAVMLVGTVPTPEEISVIMELTRIFYADVVNHLKVAKRESPPDSTKVDSAVPANPPTATDRARRVEQSEQPRLRRRDREQMKELREEIRNLRDDLHRLSELLEKRKGTETQELPESKELPEVPPVENPIEPAAAVGSPAAKEREISRSSEAIFFTVLNSKFCQQMEPTIAHLQQAGYPIRNVDAAAQPEIARQFHVDEFPCIMLTSEWVVMPTDARSPASKVTKASARKKGLIDEAELRTWLEPVLVNSLLNLTNEKRTKPLELAVGVRGELEFPHPIKTARGHDNSIIRLDQIQGSTLKLHAASPGITMLQVSLVDSADIFDVIVKVDAVNESPIKARRPLKQRIDSPQQLAKPVLMITGGDLRIRSHFDVKTVRINGPKILEVTQDDAKSTSVIALRPGLTSLWIQPEGNEASDADPIELVINAMLPNFDAPLSAGPPMRVITYAVADLLIPIGAGADFKIKTADWLRLIDQVENSIEPEMWDINGGPYSMRTFETTLSMVIRAPAETHEKIQQLFSDARRKMDVQFTVETTLPTTVDEAFFDRANVKIEFDPKNRAAILNEVTATLLRERLRGAALHAPKVTCFDGQIADYACPSGNEVDDGDKFRLHVRGKVDERTREIRMNFTVNPQNPVNDLLARSQTIPDGGYVLWDVTEEIQRERPDEPITGRVIVLTCARVIIASDEAEDVLPVKADQNRPH